MEKPAGNVRILKAGVDIRAPKEVVWSCLTDYDHLGDFVPSLEVNECMQRVDGGCKLLQAGVALHRRARAPGGTSIIARRAVFTCRSGPRTWRSG